MMYSTYFRRFGRFWRVSARNFVGWSYGFWGRRSQGWDVLLIALDLGVYPSSRADHSLVMLTSMTWVRLRLPAFCTVRLLIFSFFLLFFGSQPTLLEGREDLHNLFNYLCRYGHMDIYFILWVIIQYHRQFILSYFNFLNFILLLHLVSCGVW